MTRLVHKNNGLGRFIAKEEPQAGDILISPEGNPVPAYSISVMPGRPSIAFGKYEEALAYGRRMALVAGVDLWVAEHENDFSLVARHRADPR